MQGLQVPGQLIGTGTTPLADAGGTQQCNGCLLGDTDGGKRITLGNAYVAIATLDTVPHLLCLWALRHRHYFFF